MGSPQLTPINMLSFWPWEFRTEKAEMNELGFRHFVGIDASKSRLKEATKTSLYDDLCPNWELNGCLHELEETVKSAIVINYHSVLKYEYIPCSIFTFSGRNPPALITTSPFPFDLFPLQTSSILLFLSYPISTPFSYLFIIPTSLLNLSWFRYVWCGGVHWLSATQSCTTECYEGDMSCH